MGTNSLFLYFICHFPLILGHDSLFLFWLLTWRIILVVGFGLNAARKLRTHRKDQRWADKNYKKRALGTAFKHNPFQGASHAKGIVLEKM